MEESEYVDFSGREYSKEDAEEVLRNEEKIKSKVKGWGWSKDILHKLTLLFGIVKDTLSGEFKVSPVIIVAIITVLIYILSPVDAIPDFIPIAGQADDFTVLTMLLASITNVIDQYVEFLKKK
ncbi:YkvA family protein [Fervidobacterium sp.]